MGKKLHVSTRLNELVIALLQRVTSQGHYLSAREIEEACRRQPLIAASATGRDDRTRI